MIAVDTVKALVEQWLQGKDYFLTDLHVTPDNSIIVEIDHAEGVWIDDCVQLSRHIQEHLSRDDEDYELEVGSAGIGQPFKVRRQWDNHIGKPIQVDTTTNQRLKGTLQAVTDQGITITTRQRVTPEGRKRPILQDIDQHISWDNIQAGRYNLQFK